MNQFLLQGGHVGAFLGSGTKTGGGTFWVWKTPGSLGWRENLAGLTVEMVSEAEGVDRVAQAEKGKTARNKGEEPWEEWREPHIHVPQRLQPSGQAVCKLYSPRARPLPAL